MISRSGLYELGLLMGYKVCCGLDVIFMFLRIRTWYEYRHGCCYLASPTAASPWVLLFGITYCPPNETPHSLDATRTIRKAAKSSRSFALRLRLQRVDGRRFDALVADILCSHLHGVTAPTVSYVSAPLVRRASVHLCECVRACVRCCRCVWVCLWVCPISCVYVGACVFACRAKSTDGRAEPHGVLEAASASTV